MMTGKKPAPVTKFYPKDAASNPDYVLEQAVGGYESVLILGWDKEGNLDVRSTTNLNKAEIIWLLERFKYKLVKGDYDGG